MTHFIFDCDHIYREEHYKLIRFIKYNDSTWTISIIDFNQIYLDFAMKDFTLQNYIINV